MEKEEEMSVKMCDPERIHCKDCYWATLSGAAASYCAKYRYKPYDVYYENAECPKFENKKVSKNT